MINPWPRFNRLTEQREREFNNLFGEYDMSKYVRCGCGNWMKSNYKRCGDCRLGLVQYPGAMAAATLACAMIGGCITLVWAVLNAGWLLAKYAIAGRLLLAWIGQ